MTQEDRIIQKDRMRFTKDKLSANLVIGAIVFDALYFVSIYQSDVGSYFYNWVIGASIIYNLLFMLIAFLCSEGVKSRKTGYTPILLAIGAMQFVRIFYLPARAHAAVVDVNGQLMAAMGDSQHLYVVVCLAVSGICCVTAAVTSFINNKTLSEYLHSVENKTV